jgi:hypothetical protein
MTIRERNIQNAQGNTRKAQERAAIVLRALEEGEHIKRAAWVAGVSHRTANRYRQRFAA